MLPVPTETVVLSLPRIMGTSIAPCVFGSSDIISWYQSGLRDLLTTNMKTHCFIPCPVSTHEILILTMVFIVKCSNWCCVKATLVVRVVYHIFHNEMWVTVTENDCKEMSPNGVKSIVSYMSAALANGGGSSCFKSIAAQRSRRILMFPADICS